MRAPIISFEYVPALGRSVYVQYTVVVNKFMPFKGEMGTYVYGQYMYSDAVSGPFTFLTQQPFGFGEESPDDGVSGVTQF